MPKFMVMCPICKMRKPSDQFEARGGGHYISCADCRENNDPPPTNTLWKECGRAAALYFNKACDIAIGNRRA